ncbi:MAG: coproporphyrinogen-III oxidase family protein [Rectinemataceae bacterium]|nr:coproporphyrinogen-III oxidase family protein [Rectinemataceae bacterium]
MSGDSAIFEAPRSLYVHIPFCSSRCAYCDFHSFRCDLVSPEQRAAYVRKLLARIASLGGAVTESFDTVYIGGGTPTALEDDAFSSLVEGMGSIMGNSVKEWTVEANPESLSPRKLEIMVKSGVTRISIGLQSMDEGELNILGRKARAVDNRRAISLASTSNLALSADLITGLPLAGGTIATAPARRGSSLLSDTLGFLAANRVGHISLYDLVVEEGTLIKKRLDEGSILSVDEDDAYEKRIAAENSLSSLGYGRYEVSNYARPGCECLHNMAYWSMRSYIGIGSGAVSTLAVDRSACAPPVSAEDHYALRVDEGKDMAVWMDNPDAAAAFSWIGRKDSAFEMIMMGLRCSAGLDEQRFTSRFGLAAADLLAGTMRRWAERFSRAEGRIRLDDRGLDLLNRILVDALGEMEGRLDGNDGVNA